MLAASLGEEDGGAAPPGTAPQKTFAVARSPLPGPGLRWPVSPAPLDLPAAPQKVREEVLWLEVSLSSEGFVSLKLIAVWRGA